jgi:hypothetical protein
MTKICRQIGDVDCIVHLIRHCIGVKAILKSWGEGGG